MARVLILSSSVAAGHVGGSAGVPILQALGHDVIHLPTVFLSNHPGFAHVAGVRISPEQIEAMRLALSANGWLAGLDAVLTGYLPSPDHVAEAEKTILAVRAVAPNVRVVVDPVLGDAPKGLYIAPDAAEALRTQLVSQADVLTPNAFELGWLTGRPTASLGQAQAALLSIDTDVVLTSAPFEDRVTGVMTRHVHWRVPLQSGVPQGVGDCLAAMIAAGLPIPNALGHLQSLIEGSLGAPHLRIAAHAKTWTTAPPLEGTPWPLTSS